MQTSAYFFGKFKIWSGVVVFVYVATHLLNHALGLISLSTMEAGRELFVGFWRSAPMNWVVIGALIIHMLLAIIKTVRRKSFRGLRGGEWAQILIGLFIPAALFGHVLFTKIVHEVYAIDDSYSYYMVLNGPADFASALVFSVLAWWHGAVGIRGVLATRPTFEAQRGRWTAVAWAIPFLGLAGAASAFREVRARAALDPAFVAAAQRDILALGETVEQWDARLNAIGEGVAVGYLATLALVFSLRLGVLAWRKRRHPVRISYGESGEAFVPLGTSILEASRVAGVPHAQVCGGRGRCSTCRIRVYEGAEALPAPDLVERRVLRRIGAADNVRLACQTFPHADCKVLPILPAETQLQNYADSRFLHGADRKIAILFADLRDFTSFSEDRLPFDVVFVLNQYFQAVGKAIEARGGYLDKFIGDGAMALFGVDSDLRTGCRQAIEAAWEMGRELDRLNARLAAELDHPLRVGIGLHCGDAIVGRMGYKHTSHLTAIGDAVNTAARLESLTKEYDAQLLISEDVAGNAEMDLKDFRSVQVAIRGKSTGLYAFVVPKVDDLPVAALPAAARRTARRGGRRIMAASA